jgi:pyrroline-5-carboxylate reductase
MDNRVIGFIGGGNMTLSLIHGLIKSGYSPDRLWVSDPNLEKRQHLSALSVHCTENNTLVFDMANVIVLAVKPKDIKAVAEELASRIKDLKNVSLIISVVTGVSTELLNQWFGEQLAVVRAMPNTPALLGAGATGLYATSKVSEEQKELAESILRAVGIAVWVDHEHEIDIVIALSGSGPAYYFYIIRALQQGAEQMGLPSKIAKILSLQTALGAARMAIESDIPMEALIERVASKGGTTEKALEVFQTKGLATILKDALEAARQRSKEITEHFK